MADLKTWIVECPLFCKSILYASCFLYLLSFFYSNTFYYLANIPEMTANAIQPWRLVTAVLCHPSKLNNQAL